jgi:general secretion pathway protein K
MKRFACVQNCEGFVLVVALWILAALATLAAIYATYLNQTTRTFAASEDRLRAEAAIGGSLAVTASLLDVGPSKTSPLHGQFEFRLGPLSVATRFVSETARIDLNAASPRLLAGLFQALGQPPALAKVEADRVTAWRTPSNKGAPDVEAAQYRAAGLDYGPRHGPFASPEELWLVRDLPPDLVRRALPLVTVYTGASTIDALVASREVLSALPGITPDRLAAIEAQRAVAPDDEKALAAVLGPLQTSAANRNDVTHVDSVVNFDDGLRVRADAVIKPDDSQSGYRILAWRDDLDGPLSDAASVGTAQ